MRAERQILVERRRRKVARAGGVPEVAAAGGEAQYGGVAQRGGATSRVGQEEDRYGDVSHGWRGRRRSSRRRRCAGRS